MVAKDDIATRQAGGSGRWRSVPGRWRSAPEAGNLNLSAIKSNKEARAGGGGGGGAGDRSTTIQTAAMSSRRKSNAKINDVTKEKQQLQLNQNPSCAFCRRNDDCPEKFGEKMTYGGIMSSGLYQRGEENEGIYGFLAHDIKKEISRASRMKCRVCKINGASIGCAIRRCQKSFHFPCGVENQCIFQFTGQFESYCSQHKPVQKVPRAVRRSGGSFTCAVCLDSIDPCPSYDVLKSPCCKNTWFHRQCLQHQALSAGMFFFRCTICNNKDEFQKEMLRLGIHIPERDASWELEENAFQELLQRHHRCDARRCFCKDGREYAETEGKWTIILCKYCGSSGTHLACSLMASSLEDWECLECRDIIYKSEKLRKRTLSSEIKPTKRKFKDRPDSRHPPSKCPRLSGETQKEHKNRQIFSTRPLTSILKELRSQIKLNVISRIKVDRTNVWEGALKEMKGKVFSATDTLCIQYSDMAGKPQEVAHVTNPLYDFFNLLMHHLQNSTLFEGLTTSKNISLNSQALRLDWYYEAGRMIALSLVHGGPWPNFLSKTLFNCLAYGPDITEPTMEDVASFEVAQKVMKIKESSTLEELKQFVNENAEYLSIAGCLRPVWSLDDKELLLKDVLIFHVINRVCSPLERFCEGLKFLGVLEAIQTYPETFSERLCYKPHNFSAEIFGNLFSINFSTYRKSRIIPESKVVGFWRDYLADVEGGATKASFEGILTFATGANYIPPISFLPSPSITFLHKKGIIQNRFPAGQTSRNCLKLPMSKTYEEFKESMDFAICNTPGLKRK
ncbi:G2/M phase-specific E3 ubiquitin-protein ligase isoform X2 [Leucoraja erinacea]|uniref:G2/M phase-specific E3 ubiquitin-protein ligase isoform X2 n=1 Tax=Leucoraja erinaceus TaxID=7782 RepID=UPI0024539320|nr:G2/M phase-specific E3 ubiquitin-protein ligase isoform X2 [Leucoraja erinacea]